MDLDAPWEFLMSETIDNLKRMCGNYLEGIGLLYEQKLISPCLVLIYTTLDTLGFVATGLTSKKGFVAWVEQYLLPHLQAKCSAIDLYAARCGVLHASSSDSDLQTQGKAVGILYAWDDAKPEDLLRSLSLLGSEKYHVIHIMDLMIACAKAIDSFLDQLEKDPKLTTSINARASRCLGPLPREHIEPVADFLRQNAKTIPVASLGILGSHDSFDL
jgi:hypothetical protein